MSSPELAPPFERPETWRTRGEWAIRVLRGFCQAAGLGLLVVFLGFHNLPQWLLDLDFPAFTALALVLTVLPLLEWQQSRARRTYLHENRLYFLAVVITVLGIVPLLILPNPRENLEVWWRLTVLVWVLLGLLSLFRQVSVAGWNPAAVLVSSFALLTLLGTLLLMLPRCRADGTSADFLTALFTATSAVCVTGLVVVDTGTYWSFEGQLVILGLIQLGGLGIMTFGAFFALVVGRGLVVREKVLLGDMLEGSVLEVRRLVFAILGFTLAIEAIGALLLLTLPESSVPLKERLFFGIFHSVSAFCNAGFGLLPKGFEGLGHHWQVWGVLPALVIVGGLGFAVLYNLFELAANYFNRPARNPLFRQAEERASLRLTTRLVLLVSALLLLGGTAGIWLLESRHSFARLSLGERLSAAWFQSVVCRTAGFNTIDIGSLHASTKFLLILLMFVGASPGSTGGGVKTVTVAVCFLALRATLRGRERVEVGYRTIPAALVYRALVIVSVAFTLLCLLTLALVVVEDRPEKFLDHLFESASALATVGLSTGVTPELTPAGRCIIVLGMFVGRVGPLTLLLALAGQHSPQRYGYPPERVMLG